MKQPTRTVYSLPSPVDDGSRICVQITIPNISGHRQAFIGAISNLTHAYSWANDEDHTALAVADLWRSLFADMMQQFYDNDCGENMGCCYDIVIHRINPDTGRLEISTDDGVTWIPDPADPIYTLVRMPPPVPAGVSGTKCDAATNGKQHLEDLIAAHSEAITAAGTVAELAALLILEILAAIFAPEAVPIIWPIFLGTVAALFALGAPAFDAYWTSDERDKLLCILFCHIGEDGSFSDAGYAAVLSDMGTKLTAGVPRDMMYRDIQFIGRPGLNNLCAYGSSADADCSSCDCGCTVDTWRPIVGTVLPDSLDGYKRFQSSLSAEFPTTQVIWITTDGITNCCQLLDARYFRDGDPYLPFVRLNAPCGGDPVDFDLLVGTAMDCENQHYAEEHPGDSGHVFIGEFLFAECP